MALEDRTMFKNIWKNDEGVSPVIATILMVAITVVLAGVLVVYMQQFSGPSERQITGTSVATTFVNPVDGGISSNAGGWSVEIMAMQGGNPAWAQVKVALTKASVPLAQMNGVKTSEASLYYVNGATGTPKWYSESGPSGTVQFRDGNDVAAISLAGNEAKLGAGEFETVAATHFIVIDTNGDNNMNPGDVVFVYASNDGDTTVDITGYAIDFTMSGSQICSSNLL